MARDAALGRREQIELIASPSNAQDSAPERKEVLMYAITGITGKVGGVVARTLLSAGQRIRAVVRDPDKGTFWSDLDCEVAIAEMEDADALTRAFTNGTGVLILPPPNFDPQPGFPEARAVISAVRQALDE